MSRSIDVLSSHSHELAQSNSAYPSPNPNPNPNITLKGRAHHDENIRARAEIRAVFGGEVLCHVCALSLN